MSETNPWIVVGTLIIGVLTGVAGNALYQWIKNAYALVTDRLEIKGIWGEGIRDGNERHFSIGTIRYEPARQMWTFDGTNYHDDGNPYCHWSTIASYLDRSSHHYYYIFQNTPHDDVHAGYTGFGFVDLVKTPKGVWAPARGSFAAGNPGECFRTHSMVRLDDAPPDAEARLHAFEKIRVNS